MTGPIRVAVVRPHKSTQDLLIEIAANIGGAFLNAWVLMVVLANACPWHPGYWTTFLVIIGARILFYQQPVTPKWTWEGRKSEGGAR